MKNTLTLPLYAIFRENKHISNRRGKSESDAIKRFLIDSDLKEFTEDTELLSLFSASKAKIGIHFYYSKLDHEIFGQKYLDSIKLNL
jgi:predicted YcjX-like family ATPase